MLGFGGRSGFFSPKIIYRSNFFHGMDQDLVKNCYFIRLDPGPVYVVGSGSSVSCGLDTGLGPFSFPGSDPDTFNQDPVLWPQILGL